MTTGLVVVETRITTFFVVVSVLSVVVVNKVASVGASVVSVNRVSRCYESPILTA